MNPPSLFVLVVYISGYLFLLFAAVCLACGLYYLVELAEEYTIFTKKLIRVTILAQFPLHFFLWTYERFPFSQCAVGFASHLVYLMLLRSFPFIEPASTAFILSCLMFALSNYSWFRFFHSDAELFYRYRVAPAPAMASFFLLIVWLVPCAFFCSLTVNDSVLPSAAGPPQSGQTYGRETMEGGEKKKRSRNIVMAALDSVVFTARNALGQDMNSSFQGYADQKDQNSVSENSSDNPLSVDMGEPSTSIFSLLMGTSSHIVNEKQSQSYKTPRREEYITH